MPESIQNLLLDIAQSASASTNPVGADAARRRGRQRTVRNQLAAGVMAVALLGTSAGLALALAGNSGNAPKPITNSGTPTPNVSNSPASPSTSPSPSNSPSSGANATGATGQLNTIVPGAWTTQNNFAIDPGGWTANMIQPAIHTAERQWFYTCHAADTLTHLGANGYQETTYNTSVANTGIEADQVMFFFPSTAAAQQALGTIQTDYAHCPEPSTAINGGPITGTVQQTEQLDGGYAWLHTFRTPQGGPGQPANIAADNHEFFVQRGDVVEMLWFGGTSSVDDLRHDLGFLADLESNLCTYGGRCPATTHPLTASITANGSATLHLGGSQIEFAVDVINNSDDTLRNIAPIVSLGHCTCSNAPVPMMPLGTLQREDRSNGTWKTLFYDTEGGGMDYLLSSSAVPVPAFDLAAGQSAIFTFHLRLDPASANKLSAPYHLSNGTASIDVSLVHPVPGSNNLQIGDSPTASLPVTVLIN
jgi:hypothetical protein